MKLTEINNVYFETVPYHILSGRVNKVIALPTIGDHEAHESDIMLKEAMKNGLQVNRNIIFKKNDRILLVAPTKLRRLPSIIELATKAISAGGVIVIRDTQEGLYSKIHDTLSKRFYTSVDSETGFRKYLKH